MTASNGQKKLTIYLDGIAPAARETLVGSLSDLELVPMSSLGGHRADGLQPSVALITVERDTERAFELVATLASAGTRVGVVAPVEDAALLLRALRAGAREFVVGQDPQRLEAAVRSLATPAGAATKGGVTAVFAPKGGVGATALATNVAGVIAARGDRACVVDLDLQLGDVLASLDLGSAYTISDVLANMRRLDRDLLDASVSRHRSGIAVLAQGERIEEADTIDAPAIGRLLSFLRQQYASVLVDGLRAFDDRGLAALDACDRVLLVVTQQVAAVRNAQRCMEVFRKLGYGESKVQLVVNRFHKASNITCEVIAETVGLPVLTTIANDYTAMQRAIDAGATLEQQAPRSAASRDVRALADIVAGRPGRARHGEGVFGRLFARSEAHGAR